MRLALPPLPVERMPETLQINVDFDAAAVDPILERIGYTSQGTGLVTGQRVEVSYRSTYSVGSCIGTISADGNRITSDCRDSVCGPFRTTIERR